MTTFQILGFAVSAALLAVIVVSSSSLRWKRRTRILVWLITAVLIFGAFSYALSTRG